jgi:hypothetical protein
MNAIAPASAALAPRSPRGELLRALAGGAAFGAAYVLIGAFFAGWALFGSGRAHARGDQAFDNFAFATYMLVVVAGANAAAYAVVTGLGRVGRAGAAPRGWSVDALWGIVGFLAQLFGVPFLLLAVVPFRDRIPEVATLATMVSPGVVAGLCVVLLSRLTTRARARHPSGADSTKENAS